MILKVTLLVLSLFLFSTSSVFSASVTITVPSPVTAGDEFSIQVSATALDTNSTYSLKALGGSDSSEVQTLKNGDWLSLTSNWDLFPQVNTATESATTTTLIARFKPETASGNKDIKVRIRKSGSEDNIDSNVLSMQINARPSPSPTPTKTPSPTPSVTPITTAAPSTTPKPSPTPKKTPTPSPSNEPTDEPEVLGETDTIDSLITASPSTEPVEVGSTSKLPLVAFLFIVPGVGLSLFGAFSFLKMRKNSYNDLSENSILRPKN